MEILIKNENQVQNYEFNFEELHNELTISLEKYRNLIITDDSIKEAKASRADLNKLKKELSDKVIEIKKNHLKPFDLFKSQTDKLISLINEPVQAIDFQVKAYEQKLKDEKYKQIEKFWSEQCPLSIDIPFSKVFKDSYLNVGISLKKITEEIEVFFQKAISDVEIIKSLNSEFEIPVLEAYYRDFDMSAAMREKASFEARKQAQLERERQIKADEERIERERIERAEKERFEREEQERIIKELEKVDILPPVISPEEIEYEIEPPTIEPIKEPFCEYTVSVSESQNNLFIKFMIDNNIHFDLIS